MSKSSCLSCPLDCQRRWMSSGTSSFREADFRVHKRRSFAPIAARRLSCSGVGCGLVSRGSWAELRVQRSHIEQLTQTCVSEFRPCALLDPCLLMCRSRCILILLILLCRILQRLLSLLQSNCVERKRPEASSRSSPSPCWPPQDP